jgi:hypothetical protein
LRHNGRPFFSAETRQILVDVFAHRSFHAQVKEKGEHMPLAKLKLLRADPAAVQALSEAIKAATPGYSAGYSQCDKFEGCRSNFSLGEQVP